MSDPWEDPEIKRWAKHVREVVVPMIEDSDVVISIAPRGEPDIKFCVELGMSIMLNKPIVVVARQRKDVPPQLWLIADSVIIGDITDPNFQEEMAAKLKARLDHD